MLDLARPVGEQDALKARAVHLSYMCAVQSRQVAKSYMHIHSVGTNLDVPVDEALLVDLPQPSQEWLQDERHRELLAQPAPVLAQEGVHVALGRT